MEKKIKINRIKAVLAEKDISHKELAIRVGIAPNSVTRICNNEFQPTLKLLREMALGAGCGYPRIVNSHPECLTTL